MIQKQPRKDSEPEPLSYSNALLSTKFGFFNCFLIFVSGLVLSIVVFETAAVGFTLPLAKCDLNLTNENEGAIMSIVYVGMIVSSHLWGFLADTKGRKAVMMPTLFVGSFASLISSVSVNFAMLLILRFINGFFLAGGAAIIFAYLSEFHGDKMKARAIMAASIIFSIYAIMIPGLAFLVINRSWSFQIDFLNIVFKPWRFYLVVSALPGLLCGFLMLILPESPRFLLAVGNESKCLHVLETMYKWNGGKGHLDITSLEFDEETENLMKRKESLRNKNFCRAFLHDMWSQTVPLFKKKYIVITLITCTIQFWMYFVINGMYMWFPTVANSLATFIDQKKDDKTICEIVNAHVEEESLRDVRKDGCITQLDSKTYVYSMVMEILYFVYYVIISLVIHKIDKRIIIVIIILSSAIYGFFSFNIRQPVFAVYLYVLFFMVGVGNNVLGSATVEHFPTSLRGMALCLTLNGGRVGSVVGASIVGFLLKSYCDVTFYIGCLGLILSAALTFLLPKAKSRQPVSVSQHMLK